MASIFELTTEQSALESMVERGDITSEMAADTLEGMSEMLDDKINDYLLVRRKMGSDLAVIDLEIERLSKIKKGKENQIKNLTASLKLGLENVGRKNFDTGLFKGSFRKGSVSLKVNDVSKVPDEFVKTTITEKVDAAALKKAIQSGEVTCEGVELVTGESSLIIK